MRALAVLLVLSACSREQPAAPSPGARLEAAAVARGLVSDPEGGTPVGSFASESDRLCIVPAGRDLRLGASIDYGEGQSCTAAGSAERRGGHLRVRFGGCRFEATYDGDRIVFPPELPAACDRFCSGRASFTALAVARLSDSPSEAAAVRAGDGRLLCGS